MFVALRILAIRRTGSDLGDGKVSVPGDTPRLFAATAVPMLMISVVLPFSFQSGRLILSWFSDAQQMAIFSASFVSFLPVFSIAQVSGRSLWGDFARDRSIGLDSSLRFISSMKLGALLGGVCGAGLVLVGSRVSEFAVSGTVVVPQSIFWILGVLVFVQAIHLPSGMYLTDASGLRFQAVTSGLMCIFVVLASILGSSLLGAVGPVLALAVGMIVFQFIPCLVKAIRLLQSARLDLMSRSR
ncbi:MAG: hypothetical protein EON54_15965 [Alcaligenaceae bacterium]|nr:MAG: hypothetical protein EON54_15965 [Alcaligenaceae bacterium]